jgi:hypothetical protein
MSPQLFNPLYDKTYVNNILKVRSYLHEESVSIRKVSRLTMIIETSTIYSKNKTNPINELCGRELYYLM